MSEPHTIPLTEPLNDQNDPAGRFRIAELEGKLKQANTFIELLKGMIEQMEDETEFEGYDLSELLRRVSP